MSRLTGTCSWHGSQVSVLHDASFYFIINWWTSCTSAESTDRQVSRHSLYFKWPEYGQHGACCHDLKLFKEAPCWKPSAAWRLEEALPVSTTWQIELNEADQTQTRVSLWSAAILLPVPTPPICSAPAHQPLHVSAAWSPLHSGCCRICYLWKSFSWSCDTSFRNICLFLQPHDTTALNTDVE